MLFFDKGVGGNSQGRLSFFDVAVSIRAHQQPYGLLVRLTVQLPTAKKLALAAAGQSAPVAKVTVVTLAQEAQIGYTAGH